MVEIAKNGSNGYRIRLHAQLCAESYILRWLLRMNAKKDLRALFWRWPAEPRSAIEMDFKPS